MIFEQEVAEAIMFKTLFFASIILLPEVAIAQEQHTYMLGSFAIITQKDPFGDKDTVIAMASSGGGVFAMRCIQSTLSIGLSSTTSVFEEGAAFAVKIRADKKDIFDVPGTAISRMIAEVDQDADKIIDEVSGAKSVAVRITGSTSVTYTIPLRQSDKAAALVKKACASE